MADYQRPERLDEALRLAGEGWTILAGGTDHFPARVDRQPDERILDITGIPELGGIAETDAGYRIGATTTWTEIIEAPLPPVFDALKLAAREVGGVQIQNRGTVAGNLCNASPAADGVPPLLAMGAKVELAGGKAIRRVPLGEFVLGNRKIARRPEEIVTAIEVPRFADGARSTFLKLGARRYLVISIVMTAIVLEPDEAGRIARAGIAVGAASAAARRLADLEETLKGRPLGPGLAAVPVPDHLAPLAPIDDVRGSAKYRRDAALTLVKRGLAGLGDATVEAAA